jgi:serine/threonine protein kinase
MAPEVVANKGGYDNKADIFSVGVMMFYLLTRTYPYQQVFAELPFEAYKKPAIFPSSTKCSKDLQ